MAFQPVLFVKKNWRITKNLIWRDTLQQNTCPLVIKKYPVGDARKKAVEGLLKSQEKSSSVFNHWVQSSNYVDFASFAVSLEIAKRGKPYTDGEYIKQCFISASEELFRDRRNSKKN